MTTPSPPKKVLDQSMKFYNYTLFFPVTPTSNCPLTNSRVLVGVKWSSISQCLLVTFTDINNVTSLSVALCAYVFNRICIHSMSWGTQFYETIHSIFPPHEGGVRHLTGGWGPNLQTDVGTEINLKRCTDRKGEKRRKRERDRERERERYERNLS